MKKLCICIPVYNREKLFRRVLDVLLFSVKKYKSDIEVLIVDNHSEDDLKIIFEELRSKYPEVELTYHRNGQNIGAYNAILALSKSRALYSWLIGSDDYLLPENLDRVMEILLNRNIDNKINYLIGGMNYVNLENLEHDNISFTLEKNIPQIREASKLISSKEYSNILSSAKELNKYIHPKFNNVYLGSMMSFIIKTELCKDKISNITKYKKENANLINWYPHVIIHSHYMKLENCVFLDSAILTAGEGMREWTNDDNNPLFTSATFIYARVIREILDLYRKNGLGIYNYYSSILDNSLIVGELFIKLLFELKKNNKPEWVSKTFFIKLLKSNFYLPTFYLGIIKGIIKFFLGK